MISQSYNNIVTPELFADAILNKEFPGFEQDYLVLHCLIKLHQPGSFFEIGTNHGTGTKIIKNAIGPSANVFSLDLPTSLVHPSLLGTDISRADNVGINCDLPFIQVRGDSMHYNYNEHPCDGYFVDGEHDYDHVAAETIKILVNQPKIIIYHDADIPGVYDAITDTFKAAAANYNLYRVVGTRIAYALKK